MTFGTRLRKNRERHRLSQKEVAEQIGVSQSTYYNWETDASSCRVEFLVDLARVLDVSITELLPGSVLNKNIGDQGRANHIEAEADVAVNRNDLQEVYKSLLSSKDEIIQLLKEENAVLKVLNAQMEGTQKRRV